MPLQPTVGLLERIPLGGDGFTSPIAAYALTRMQVSGAAGGGSWLLQVSLDPRFCSLVSYVTVEIEQDTVADTAVQIQIEDARGRQPVLYDSTVLTATSKTVDAVTVARTWNPTPTIIGGGGLLPIITAKGFNLDSDEYFISMLVYLFDIRVRETTPIGPLLWARGAT